MILAAWLARTRTTQTPPHHLDKCRRTLPTRSTPPRLASSRLAHDHHFRHEQHPFSLSFPFLCPLPLPPRAHHAGDVVVPVLVLAPVPVCPCRPLSLLLQTCVCPFCSPFLPPLPYNPTSQPSSAPPRAMMHARLPWRHGALGPSSPLAQFAPFPVCHRPTDTWVKLQRRERDRDEGGGCHALSTCVCCLRR
ncbi:hypothetical protein IWX90DRAFT_421416 [Phyllosticta citrichinensis]|uniref:Uncharacterized protein n=1 Tax=Phyllosticta citrichinensis TaxID=1130410 RepID=A0ABR1Y7Q6_9PEZI